MSENLEKFASSALKVMQYAQEEARLLNHEEMGTEHILLGIVRDEKSTAAQILLGNGVEPENARLAVERLLKRGETSVKGEIPLSRRARRTLDVAFDEAEQFGQESLSSELLLLGLLDDKNSNVVQLLENLAVNVNNVKEQLIKFISKETGENPGWGKLSMKADELEEVLLQVSKERSGDIEPFAPSAEPDKEISTDEENAAKEQIKEMPGFKSSLMGHLEGLFKEIEQVILTGGGKPLSDAGIHPFSALGSSLVEQARADEFDPLIGREPETERLLTVLNRRQNGHALLVGESGVGKAAIIQWLAQGVAQLENVGSDIIWVQHGKLVELLLNPGRVMELTARLTQPIILCVREFDRIAEFAGKESRFAALYDLASHPLVRLIGTTTLLGYERLKQLEPVLTRRFQIISIEEPDAVETFQIMLGLKPRYEKHHSVQIEETALQRAILFSQMFIPQRVLPAKAIEILDEACSLVALRRNSKPAQAIVTATHITEILSHITGRTVDDIEAEML